MSENSRLYFLLRKIKDAVESLPIQLKPTEKNATIKQIKITNGITLVPKNKKWDILCGAVNHVTGTTTIFKIFPVDQKQWFFTYTIAAGDANKAENIDWKNNKPYCREDTAFYFNADANSYVVLQVMETDL